MSSITRIKREVEKLSAPERRELLDRLEERAEAEWDRQIGEDFDSGLGTARCTD